METFPLRCGRENGEYLELRIPQVLYRSFECTISTDEGRGYLVNLFYIKNVGRDIELLDEIRIPIGEKMREEFDKGYEIYMRRVRR